MPRFILPILKLFVSAGILVYLISSLDLTALRKPASRIDWSLVFLSVLQMSFIAPLGGLRWRIVMCALGHDKPLTRLTGMFWLGMTFNQVLPSSVGGDAVRIWLAYRDGAGIHLAISSVFLERVVITLMLFLFILTFSTILTADLLEGRLYYAIVICAAFSTFCLVLMPFASHPFRLLLPKGRLRRSCLALIKDSQALLLTGRYMAPLLLVSAITLLNICLAAWWLASAIGLGLPFLDLLLVVPLVTIVVMLPVTIGGWGARELALVYLLGRLGVTEEAAFLFSVLFGALLVVVSLPGLFFLRDDRRARGVRIILKLR